MEFRLLGEFEVRVDDHVVNVGPTRQKCVLIALLLDANKLVPVDQLVERVWADDPPRRALNTLYGYVHRLRHSLADVHDVEIIRKPGGYTLTVDPAAVDVGRFRDRTARARTVQEEQRRLELLEDALRQWRGPAFAGIENPWLTSVRQTLERQRFAAELDLSDLLLHRGRYRELLGDLSVRVEAHPLDERLAAQFILALCHSGQQAKALDEYERIRRRLAGELGVDPSPTLRELHQRILTADDRLLAGSATKSPVPSTAPRQLPARPRQFTGRSGELALLDNVMDAVDGHGTVVVSAIGGGGGMGKTWLALQWAHSRIDRFPDGQLYVNLRGFDPAGDPVHPAEALRGFLCALGIEASAVPADLETRTGLYRTMTAGRKLLILLDNARDSAQVVPLLPGGSTCTVIVTSRDRLAGLVIAQGAQPLALDVLDADEARSLLAGRITAARLAAEPDAVEEILEHCGGLPLALGIVASRAAIEPGMPLRALAAELGEATTRLGALDYGDHSTSLRAVLNASERALPPEQAEVFRLLGLAPGADISLSAAVALTGLPGLPGTEVAKVLHALERVSLVSRHRPGRYRMHDLIRLYAAEQAPPNDTALRRLVDFYLHTAHAADRLLDPHSPPIELTAPIQGCPDHPLADEAAALAWLDAEHHCLLAAQQHAVERGWLTCVWQMAWGLTTFHLRRGHLHDDISAWRRAIDAARQLDDVRTEALAHRMLGDTYARMGDHVTALDHLGSALLLAEKIDDIPGRAHAHIALAHAWATQGDDTRALSHTTCALPLYRRLNNSVWEARTLNQMGRSMARLGHAEEADEHCEAALALSRRHHDRHGEADALAGIGYLAHHAGRHTKALDHDVRAAALYHELGDIYKQADTLEHLGHVHVALGQPDQAHRAWCDALDLYLAQHRHADAGRVRRLQEAFAHHRS